MNPIVLAALLGCTLTALAQRQVHAQAQGADRDRTAPAPPPVLKSAKERLGDKTSDEQRVNDCKVPPGRRTQPRPASCPWDPTS